MAYQPEHTLGSGDALIYPVDANPNDFFPECIKFTVKQRLGMNIDKVVKETASSMKDLYKSLSAGKKGLAIHKQIQYAQGRKEEKGILEWIGELTEEFKGATGLSYDDLNMGEIATDAYKKLTSSVRAEHGRVSAANSNLKPSQQNRKTLGAIYMNMPNNIQFSEGANWGGQELGVGGDVTRRTVGGTNEAGGSNIDRLAGAAFGSIGNLAGAGVGGMVGGLFSAMGLSGGTMVGLAAGAFSGERMQKGFEAGLSISQNPYMEMMFSGIGFRSFRFDFVLRPRHEKELMVVGNILKSFREFSRPSFNDSFGGQAFFNYPMEFDIQFLTLDEGEGTFANNYETNWHLPQLKPCVLSSVETNYTPQSIWAAHRAGAPVAVTLGLSFQETELVMAEDIQSTDWPNGGGEGLDVLPTGGPNPNSSEPSAIDRFGGPASQWDSSGIGSSGSFSHPDIK